MPKKIYVSPKKVLTRLQINQDLTGVESVLISAIVGAQLHIESVLDSRFELRTWTSTYYLDSEAFSGLKPNGMYRMEIPSGFIRQDQPFSIQADLNWRMAAAQAVPSTDYLVDYTRGLVSIDAGQSATGLPQIIGYDWAHSQVQPSGYAERFIRITCTTGFKTVEIEDLEDDPIDPVPDWVEEAIISYCGIVLDVSQSAKNKVPAAELYKRAGDHAMSIIAPYNRRKGLTFRPMMADSQ